MAVGNSASETTPLLPSSAGGSNQPKTTDSSLSSWSWRAQIHHFVEAHTPAGRWYERFLIVLIALNVLALILGTLCVPPYTNIKDSALCDRRNDALWFGNRADNGLLPASWGLSLSTSCLELITIAVFTMEYLLRFLTCDLIPGSSSSDRPYAGWWGRLRFVFSFFSLVDLASTLPFYIDTFVFTHSELGLSSSFLRMFRLLRMMRVEGRYDTALTMVDDVWRQQQGILQTALFVGVTTWITVSALYYLTERHNHDMIYCPTCLELVDDHNNTMQLDTSGCVFDAWGRVDCTAAGCPGTAVDPYPCYNLYESIPMASYYSLLNLFGEFPLITNHSSAGQIVATLVAVVAVAFFALPAGIIGNGFEQVIEKQRQERLERGEAASTRGPIIEQGGITPGHVADHRTSVGYFYNLLHGQTAPGSATLDMLINFLILSTALSFMLDTLSGTLTPEVRLWMDCLELIAVLVFTVEYTLRVYAAKADPKYAYRGGRFFYMTTFLALVDVLSVVPYWLQVAWTGQVLTYDPTHGTNEQSAASWTVTTLVQSLRLLRILRFERYTHAFTSFDDVIRRHVDVLAVTAFTALLCWVFFAAWLYLTERDNPNPEMASNYNNLPNAMWVTLLNLSGESPLCQYSAAGKVATGILGLFATGIFGIPIGVLGAGFEQVVEEENEDNTEELQGDGYGDRAAPQQVLGTHLERGLFHFVNGEGSYWAGLFEMSIYLLIFVAVAVGVWQTVEGQENAFHEVEWIAVVIFTLEYLMRLVGVGADPLFATGRNALTSRLHFIISFYSMIDLMAIVPFYLAWALPNSFVNQYDEYLRMLRIIRLLKLDKYIPSITLIDDVVRLKFNALRVAFYAAITLWILFTAFMYLFEHQDFGNDIDPVPLYGCDADCTMADRFRSYFDSLVYTGIHLTGDYPIITYSWPARAVNFLMVIAAVGVVSIPSGLIASGFVAIVQSKAKARRGEPLAGGRVGDDWYEVRYRELEGVEPPPSPFGTTVDKWQVAVNEFLNGKKTSDGHHKWTYLAYGTRIFLFTIIISNVLTVILESVPSIDLAVGNDPGNFFDRFEAFSVMVFATEYILRLFCAPKNREALYSSLIYATTFFGIVDLLSTAPWFVQQALIATHHLDEAGDNARIFRIFRIFRILQLEDFVTAFSKLDNVFRASQDVLKATGLLALIIWVGCGALFYIFEENNPNWRQCDDSVPAYSDDPSTPGCFNFASTKACNEWYPGLCSQTAFKDMPNALYFTAVFLGGEWGVVDFTWPGRLVCLFLCVVGIALYAIPIGTLFDSFGAVLGLAGDDDEEEEDQKDEPKLGILSPSDVEEIKKE